MGYKFEFNWALKLKPEEGFPQKLKIGDIYQFHKKESRLYPLGCNIDLIDQNWNVFAQVEIIEFTVNESKTKGKFKINRIYLELEKKSLTEIARRNSELLKQKGYVTK